MPRKQPPSVVSPFYQVDWSKVSFGKLILLVAMGIAAVCIIFWMFQSLSQTVRYSMQEKMEYGEEVHYADAAHPGMGGGTGASMPHLSVRNMLPPPEGGGTPGVDAEAFEVNDHSATFRRTSIDSVCASVLALKKRPEVIFEYAEEAEKFCTFRFKVARTYSNSVLTTLSEMKPEEMGVRTETIKNQVVDYTQTLSILDTKLQSIEAALLEAQGAYEELAEFAVSAGDAETLANVINSKLALIDRLTQERLMVAAEIERMMRAKENELERIDFVFFSVTAYAEPVFDLESIADSWKRAVAELVGSLNSMAQAVTVGLIMFIMLVAQIALYAFLILIIVKFGIRFARKVWDW
jgi:hypothetical protein